MATRILLVPALTAVLVVVSGFVLAADQAPAQPTKQTQKQVYGKELMTEHERAELHARMQAAKTQQERDQIRQQQHERMKQRAKERGLSIPDQPPAKSGRKGGHRDHDDGDKGQ